MPSAKAKTVSSPCIGVFTHLHLTYPALCEVAAWPCKLYSAGSGVDVVLEWLAMFSEDLEIPKTLREIGVEDISRMHEVTTSLLQVLLLRKMGDQLLSSTI